MRAIKPEAFDGILVALNVDEFVCETKCLYCTKLQHLLYVKSNNYVKESPRIRKKALEMASWSQGFSSP